MACSGLALLYRVESELPNDLVGGSPGFRPAVLVIPPDVDSQFFALLRGGDTRDRDGARGGTEQSQRVTTCRFVSSLVPSLPT